MENIVFGLAFTIHLGMSNEYNGIHPTVKYKYNEYTIGTFYNSEKNISLYASRDIDLKGDLKLEGGLVSGYSKPIIPFLRLKYNDYFIAPGIGGEDFGIVVGKEFRF
jgi:hypothetical protein